MPKGKKIPERIKQEVVDLRSQGYLYKEIRQATGIKDDSTIHSILRKAGISRENSKHSGARSYADIRNVYIRDAMRAKRMTKKDFARYAHIGLEKANSLLYGDSETRLTVWQIKRILKLTGGTFEEVFG